jgi:carbohydrate-selective porin OprB
MAKVYSVKGTVIKDTSSQHPGNLWDNRVRYHGRKASTYARDSGRRVMVPILDSDGNVKLDKHGNVRLRWTGEYHEATTTGREIDVRPNKGRGFTCNTVEGSYRALQRNIRRLADGRDVHFAHVPAFALASVRDVDPERMHRHVHRGSHVAAPYVAEEKPPVKKKRSKRRCRY